MNAVFFLLLTYKSTKQNKTKIGRQKRKTTEQFCFRLFIVNRNFTIRNIIATRIFNIMQLIKSST